MVRLKDLLQAIDIAYEGEEWIDCVTDRSYEVHRHTLFVCLKGAHHDGHDYIEEVQSKGAFVLAEKHYAGTFYCPCLRIAYAKLLNVFYEYPAEKMTMIGVTGTNGKTSVTAYLYQLLKNRGHNVILIGTEGNYLNDDYLPSKHTTDDLLTLMRLFYQGEKMGAKYVVMEVSSQALDQHRVEAFRYDYAILTSLAQDHLDYHHTLAAYYEAKLRLFRLLKPHGVVLLPHDAPVLEAWRSAIEAPVITYGKDGEYGTEQLYCDLSGCSFRYQGIVYTSAILGQFTMQNLNACLAVSSLMCKEFSPHEIKQLTPVAGRMEAVLTQPFSVYVDFAHTPQALEETLSFFRAYAKGRLAVLFGCGGQREQEKRPLMGAIASRYADLVVLTSDNARNEDPLTILQMIREGTNGNEWVEPDRYQAIKKVLDWAQDDDIIVLAGKGNEQYQLIGNESVAFSDCAVVQELLRKEGILCT